LTFAKTLLHESALPAIKPAESSRCRTRERAPFQPVDLGLRCLEGVQERQHFLVLVFDLVESALVKLCVQLTNDPTQVFHRQPGRPWSLLLQAQAPWRRHCDGARWSPPLRSGEHVQSGTIDLDANVRRPRLPQGPGGDRKSTGGNAQLLVKWELEQGSDLAGFLANQKSVTPPTQRKG
jgi:hypothetical protein